MVVKYHHSCSGCGHNGDTDTDAAAADNGCWDDDDDDDEYKLLLQYPSWQPAAEDKLQAYERSLFRKLGVGGCVVCFYRETETQQRNTLLRYMGVKRREKQVVDR